MPELLTPSESQAFQTFLSSMDYNDSHDMPNSANVDWAAYQNGIQEHSVSEIPHIQGREALTKATKDLMSLDAESWNSAPAMHHYQQQQHAYNFNPQYGYYQQQNEAYFLPKQGSQSPHTFPSRSSYSSMGSPPAAASSSSFSFAGSSNPSPPPSTESGSSSSGAGFNKRAAESTSYVPSNKRSRPSPPAAASSLPTKQTLLSPSQKKANHIQSEQKRRANIRRGYEALCDTIPALREAIRLEEEAQMVDAVSGNGKRSKRGRRTKIDDGTGEKIDGRAGPRSENIVLGKTIEYIKELLSDRQDLLARLEHARSSLAPDHPSSKPLDPQPLWEREWKGGSGKEAEAEDDEEEED